ncbi:tetratricopeptide repeat protein, partial [bacterium]
ARAARRAWTLVVAAKAEADRRRFKEALSLLEAALRREPGSPKALAWTGEVLRRSGKPEEARRAFDAALAAEPGNAWALAARAEAKRALGLTRDGLEDFKAAVRLNPRCEAYADFVGGRPPRAEHAFLLAWRGEGRRAAGDARGARADLDLALALDRFQPWALLSRAVARGDAGDHAGRLADFAALDAAAPGLLSSAAQGGGAL